MTAPSLADDLDLIGALDFDPPCGSIDGCDRTATHVIALTEALDDLAKKRAVRVTCPCCRDAKLVVERIEPIR